MNRVGAPNPLSIFYRNPFSNKILNIAFLIIGIICIIICFVLLISGNGWIYSLGILLGLGLAGISIYSLSNDDKKEEIQQPVITVKKFENMYYHK